MFKKTYYFEVERFIEKRYHLKYELVGKSFRVISVFFWQTPIEEINKELKEIEKQFNCHCYIDNIKRL